MYLTTFCILSASDIWLDKRGQGLLWEVAHKRWTTVTGHIDLIPIRRGDSIQHYVIKFVSDL